MCFLDWLWKVVAPKFSSRITSLEALLFQCLDAFFQWRQNRHREILFQSSVSNMSPDSMSGCVYKNGLSEVVATKFSVSIPFVDTVLAPGDLKKSWKKKGRHICAGDQAQDFNKQIRGHFGLSSWDPQARKRGKLVYLQLELFAYS